MTTVLILTRRVKAPITVFAVGTWVSGNSALVRDLASAGHELANHTLNHPALRRLDRVRVAAEIAGCATALRSATGSPGAWFRPSGTPTPTPLMSDPA